MNIAKVLTWFMLIWGIYGIVIKEKLAWFFVVFALVLFFIQYEPNEEQPKKWKKH